MNRDELGALIAADITSLTAQGLEARYGGDELQAAAATMAGAWFGRIDRARLEAEATMLLGLYLSILVNQAERLRVDPFDLLAAYLDPMNAALRPPESDPHG